MVDVIYSGERAAAQQDRQREWVSGGADAMLRQLLIEPKEGAARPASWVPTLAGLDLACLLRVIESELIPRLVGECRPAKRSSLKPKRPG